MVISPVPQFIVALQLQIIHRANYIPSRTSFDIFSCKFSPCLSTGAIGTINTGLPNITVANPSNPNHCQASLVGPIGSPPNNGNGVIIQNGGQNLSIPSNSGLTSLGTLSAALPYGNNNGPNGILHGSNGNGGSQSGNGSSPPVVGSGGDGPSLNVGGAGGSGSSAGAGSNSSGSGAGGGAGSGGSGGSGVGSSAPAQQHLVQFEPPPRPGRGSEGRCISLRANHFEIRVPKGFLHHYDVSITPEKCPRRVNRYVCGAFFSICFHP